MFCPKCGNDAGNSHFCPECGANLQEISPKKNEPSKDINSVIPIVEKSIKRAATTKNARDIVLAILGVLVMIAYTVLPTDIIPDFIPGPGLIDDGIVDVGSLVMIISRVVAYKKRKKNK